MRVIGWIGLVILVIAIIAITFGASVKLDPDKKENPWHWIGIIGGLILAVLAVIMIIKGSACDKVPKGYTKVIVPSQFAQNIQYDINQYFKGGEKPCFARGGTTAGKPGFFGRMFNRGGSAPQGETAAAGVVFDNPVTV